MWIWTFRFSCIHVHFITALKQRIKIFFKFFLYLNYNLIAFSNTRIDILWCDCFVIAIVSIQNNRICRLSVQAQADRARPELLHRCRDQVPCLILLLLLLLLLMWGKWKRFTETNELQNNLQQEDLAKQIVQYALYGTVCIIILDHSKCDIPTCQC